MKTWKLTVNEEELKALITYHANRMSAPIADTSAERSARLHDLTKRLNKDTPEIESDPRPKEAPEAPASAWG